MWFGILLIATAALEFSAPGCLADVATLNVESARQQNLLLPFNDLLPPLLDSETGATTTTTTEAFTTHVTKRTTDSITRTLAQTSTTLPTKKSYYQQQQKQLTQNNKELHAKPKLQQPQQKSKLGEQQQQHKSHEIQLLSLDLLPPFESANDEAETQQKEHHQQTHSITKPSVAIKPKQLVAKPSKHVPIITKPAVPVKPITATAATNIHQTHTVKQQQQQQQQQHQHQQQHFHAAAPVLPQHFADYSYQHTTRRPARGPLPTLTPFPKHFRK